MVDSLVSTAFDDNFYRMTNLTELTPGRPEIFRAGGRTTLIRLDSEGRVSAIDGSCNHNDLIQPGATRLETLLDCIARKVGSTSKEWNDLLNLAGFPVRIEGEQVWVGTEDILPGVTKE